LNLEVIYLWESVCLQLLPQPPVPEFLAIFVT
jgi:hypothetical protein